MSGESTGFSSSVCWPFQPFRLSTQSPARGASFWPQSSFCAPHEIGSSRTGGSAQWSVASANRSGWGGGRPGGGRGGEGGGRGGGWVAFFGGAGADGGGFARPGREGEDPHAGAD